MNRLASTSHTVYALDSTTIDVCLSLCPWAPHQQSRGAVKMHTLLDLRGSIPTFIHITHGRVHDVLALDHIAFEAGAFYILDRGYLHFRRLFRLHQSGAFFVTRALRTTRMKRLSSRPVSKATGLRSDKLCGSTGYIRRVSTHHAPPHQVLRP